MSMFKIAGSCEVAPYPGAWIEIIDYEEINGKVQSLLTQERGLKYTIDIEKHDSYWGRSLPRSVD